MDHAKLVVIRMEEARDSRGISVAELARRASIDRKRLWYILDGQRQMRADEFIRLCAVMGLDMGFFLTNDMKDELAGHRTVAFESLALDGNAVATHEGIEDEGQSVDLVEKPGPGNPKTGLVQTGDANKILPLVCLAVVAALTATLAALREKRRNRAEDGTESEERMRIRKRRTTRANEPALANRSLT